MCDYCEYSKPLPVVAIDLDAFPDSTDVYIEGVRMVVEKYDGLIMLRINCCPMCGERLGGEGK